MYIKKAWRKAVDPSIKMYINKIENRITFKIKTGYYIGLVTSETIKLLGSTKSNITKSENGENFPILDITEVALVLCNIVKFQEFCIYLFLIHCLVNCIFTFLKTFDLELLDIEVWLTDQNSNSLEIEDKINITLINN